MNYRYYQNFNDRPSTSRSGQRHHPYSPQKSPRRYENQGNGLYSRRDWDGRNNRNSPGNNRIAHYSRYEAPRIDNSFNSKYFESFEDDDFTSYVTNKRSKESIYDWALHFNDYNVHENIEWPERPFAKYVLTEENIANELKRDKINKVTSTNGMTIPAANKIIGGCSKNNEVASTNGTTIPAVETGECSKINEVASTNGATTPVVEIGECSKNNDETLDMEMSDFEDIIDDDEEVNDSKVNETVTEGKSKSWRIETRLISGITKKIRTQFGKVKNHQLVWSKLFDRTYPLKVEVLDLPLNCSKLDITEHFKNVNIEKIELVKFLLKGHNYKLIAFLYPKTHEDFKKCFSYHSTKVTKDSSSVINVFFPIHDEKYIGHEKLRRNIILDRIRRMADKKPTAVKAVLRKIKRKANKAKVKQNILDYGHPF